VAYVNVRLGQGVAFAMRCARGASGVVTLSLTGAAGAARVIAAAAIVVGTPLLAWAQSAPNAADARKKLEAEASLKRQQAVVDKNAQELKGITARLVETGKHIQDIEARLSAIEAKQGELEKQEKELRDSLERRHGTISALLATLQRMGRNPPPVMVTRREDALTVVRSAMLLAPAIPKLHGQAAELAEELGKLSGVLQSRRAESERLRAEKVLHDKARVNLTAQQEAKRKAGAQSQADLERMRQEVARLAEGAKEVSDLLPKLDKEFQDPTVSPGSPKVAAVLAPSGQKVLTLNRLPPQMPFAQAKGKLQLPIQGQRVISFGEKTNLGSPSKNIGIRTRFSATVLSPCDGLVVYAGEFRAYGQLLIISAGDGYHVLISGLSQIDVQVGQSVLMGEPVGVMSSATTAKGTQDNRGPVLSVEFQKDRRPIDPDPWWSEASRKGQG
jgi:murein hydrolase activator